MKVSEYTKYDATGLAELVRKKEVSPLELLDTAMDAMQQVNPDINAVIDYTYDYAKKQIDDGIDLDAPFCGVPFLVKDSGYQLKGVRSTIGSRLAGDGVYTSENTTLQTRFQRAGVVVVATTATPEFCWGSSTETLRHGPTRNPWNLEYSPCGSSGGTASMIAAGGTPFGHGSDGGGSIRMPASSCGLVGLKPTRFRVPNGPFGGDQGLAVNFLLSRSVRDTAIMLDAVQGPDPGAYGAALMPDEPYAQIIKKSPKKLKIAYMLHLPYRMYESTYDNPDVQRATLEFVDFLRSLGHECVEAYPQLDEDYHIARILSQAAGTNLSIEKMSRQSGLQISEETLEPLVYKAYIEQQDITGAQMELAMSELAGVSRSIGRWMMDYDVLVCPTMGILPPKIGTVNPFETDRTVQQWIEERRRSSGNCGMSNVTGMPSITVPFALSADGVPIGMEIDARIGDDAIVLQLAAEIERVRPWSVRRPSVFAK